jgi:hypothetical protein
LTANAARRRRGAVSIFDFANPEKTSICDLSRPVCGTIVRFGTMLALLQSLDSSHFHAVSRNCIQE